MAKPVISKEQQNNQQNNFGLPAGFVLDDNEPSQPVISKRFVLDKEPQNNQQSNFGLPAGFILDDDEFSQPKMSMGEEYRSRGEEYFINNISAKYLPFISDKKLQENIRNASSDPQSKAFFTTATNPLGAGVRLKAAIAAGLAKTFGGAATKDIDIGDLYEEAKIAEKSLLDKARQDYPLTSFAGQVFSDVGIAGKALGAAGLAGQGFGTAVKGGALLGGTSALGETEDLTNIPQTLKDVGTGTVVGGVVGGAVQQAIPYVVSGIQNIASKAKQSTSYVKNLFTKDTAEEVGAKAIDPESAKLALKELMDKPSDKPLTAVDIQNPEFKTFARSVVSKYPQAREIVKDFTEGRNKEAFTRINDDLKIISKVDNADDYTKQISDTQKSLASPLYAEAEADRTIVPKFEFKEIKTITSPQTTTVSEGVKSFKTDSSTKTKTDFITKYNLQSKSRDIEKPLVSKEEKELFKQAKGSFEGSNKEELFNIADKYKTTTKDLKKYAPKSPLQVIKELGGIADDRGELASLGITNKTLPGLLRKEGTQGVGIDDVGEKLYKAGYFKERPTVSGVLDFIDKELRNTAKGNRATTFSQDSTKYNEAKQFLDEADSLGINIDAINKLRKITPQTSKTGTAGIKAGSSYDKRDLAKKGIEEFQNTLRKQTTRIEEGGKIVNVRKEVTNFDQLSPKSIELAKQLDELENNQIFQETRNKAKQFLNPDALDNSIETLHATREMFDDKISVGIRSGQDKEVRRLTILRGKIDNLIGEVSPTFKEADNVFRPLAVRKDAVKFGKEFNKFKPSIIAKKINEFTTKSGLKKEDILNDIRVGAKDIILKDVEKLIKFEGSNIPTEIQVKKIIETKFKRDQLQTFLGEKDYNQFVENINKEALFNKVSKSLGLNKPTTQEESKNFILKAFNGLISYKTSGFGKYATVKNSVDAGEQFLTKNYRGLNSQNAKEIAKIIIDKDASIKYLDDIINKASKEQKPLVSQAINDLLPLKSKNFILTNSLTQYSLSGGNEANAAEISEDEAMRRYKEAAPTTKYMPDQQEIRRILGKPNQQSKK